MPNIHIKNQNKSIVFNPPMNLLNNLLIAGVEIDTVCGGKAICGRCRIKMLSPSKYISPMKQAERKRLGDQLIKEGWRLACQTYALRDIEIYIPPKGSDEGFFKSEKKF